MDVVPSVPVVSGGDRVPGSFGTENRIRPMKTSRRGFLQASFMALVGGRAVALCQTTDPQRLEYHQGRVVYTFPLDLSGLQDWSHVGKISSILAASSSLSVEQCDFHFRYLVSRRPQQYESSHPIPPIHLMTGDSLNLTYRVRAKPPVDRLVRNQVQFYSGRVRVFTRAVGTLHPRSLVAA
jgi:hypothetical protein